MTGKCIQLFQMLVQEHFICPPRPLVLSELSAGERFALSQLPQLSCFNFPVFLFTPLLPWVFFFFHFSPSPSYFPLSLFIHLLTGHVLDSWAHSCHRCHSESLHRAWCGAACSVSLRPYTPSPRGKRSKPIISPPQPFLKWKPSQVANRGQS